MKKKWWVTAAIAVLIAIIVILNVVQQDKGKPVEIAVVKKGGIVSKVSASGELKAKAQVNISAEIIAKVKKIYYKEGDQVKKGSLMILFDDIQAEANFKLAEARLKQNRQDFDRINTLFEKKLISQGEFEQMKLSYRTAEAQYEQAYDAFQKTRVYAPISGRIMKLNIEEGETAVMGTMNYAGTALATIADLSHMIAIVKIDETDVPNVRVGQPVEVIADALPDSTFPGKVVKVGLMPITSSQLSAEKTTDFEVEVELESFSSFLRPGMNVNTSIITSQKDSVLVVPVQAVGSRKMDDTLRETVFVLKSGTAMLQRVAIGASSDTESEVTEGLVEGDTVINGPYRVLSKLKDKEKVKYKPANATEK